MAHPRPILIVSASKPTDELRFAAAALKLPVDWRDAAPDGLVHAAIVRAGQEPSTPFVELRANASAEGYIVPSSSLGEVILAANSQHGLANGLYDARRALLAADATDTVPADLLTLGEHKPYFARREIYHFLCSWDLPWLNPSTFTIEQWKTHLDRIRALNVNHFHFDIWADQYYHPDYPQTYGNKALYDRLRAACDYAHQLGMRTGFFAFPCQTPVWAYLAHPEARPVEVINYQGIHVCPSRNWDAVTTFDTFLIEYFGMSLDDVVVEMQDPGSCVCEACCQQFPELVLRFIETYRNLPGGPSDRRVDLCSLHFRDWLEEPVCDTRVVRPIKDLRKRVFDALPPGTALYEIDEPTLEMGRQRNLKQIYFFFDLDPESGLENQQVFPLVKLRRIESQVRKSVEDGHDGLKSYRMMPFLQYVADYVLFRKCWDPAIDLDVVLAELAAEWGIPAHNRTKFVKAIRGIDAWWEERDLAALKQSDAILQELAADAGCSEFLVDLKDLVVVFAVLADFWSRHKDAIDRPDFYPPLDLVRQCYSLMRDTRIFSAYTIHQHWEVRAREMIGQRLRWWLQNMKSTTLADAVRPPS